MIGERLKVYELQDLQQIAIRVLQEVACGPFVSFLLVAKRNLLEVNLSLNLSQDFN